MNKEYAIKSVTSARGHRSIVATLADDKQISIGNGVVNDLMYDLQIGFRDVALQAPTGGFKLVSEGPLVEYKIGDFQHSYNNVTKKIEKTANKHVNAGWQVPVGTFPVLKASDGIRPRDLTTSVYSPLLNDGELASLETQREIVRD